MMKWLCCNLFHRCHWIQKGREFMGGALFCCPKCNEHRSSD